MQREGEVGEEPREGGWDASGVQNMCDSAFGEGITVEGAVDGADEDAGEDFGGEVVLDEGGFDGEGEGEGCPVGHG